MPSHSTKHILLTIDVEDWFQVENFRSCIPIHTWDDYEIRAEGNTHRLLDSFDAISSRLEALRGPATTSPIKATFFVLGWLAERAPHLVREIHARGHEVASHGYGHKMCSQCTPKDLSNDLLGSKKLLEDIIGAPVVGYRAPSFSVNDDVLRIIESCGYRYDSSFNSFTLNNRYGRVDLAQRSKMGIAHGLSETLYELPISNLELRKCILPFGGGGYFRLFPLALFSFAVRSILKRQDAYLFYMHPWEIDPGQPRVTEASRVFRMRHYLNLDKTLDRLAGFIEDFPESRFLNCREYLENTLRSVV